MRSFLPLFTGSVAPWIFSLWGLLLPVGSTFGQVLDSQKLLESQSFWDNRDWDWYKKNIPFFECPDATINTTYYYRWELLTKHLTYGSPNSGYSFTEFIDRPFWSGAYGAISCPAGHQLYEARWLRDSRYARDFARYWFRTPGAQPRNYSTWLADAIWAVHQVHPDEPSLKDLLPDLIKNYEGWEKRHFVPEVGLFWQTGHDDGMEFNINSRQTKDILRGAPAYRPSFNAFMWADALAIARIADLASDKKTAERFHAKADALKENVLKKLWDPQRQFFFPMAHRDEERDGHVVKRFSLTYQTGQFPGSKFGRELHGYVPWQFNLPDAGKETAWKSLMDKDGFFAPFGPTTVERGDPLFKISKSCCWWSGNSWPYATTQTLVAMANLLRNYRQDVVTKDDYLKLLQIYTKTHQKNGKPYLAEACNPDTGSFEGHDGFNHSEHYFHSSYTDLIITGLVGLRPRSDRTIEIHPLVPQTWDYFALDQVPYQGHQVCIKWDREGKRYGIGPGLHLFVDGKRIANAPRLEPITAELPARKKDKTADDSVNFAVNNDGHYYPRITASYSHPKTPISKLVDGNYWYSVSPPNRWTCEGSPNKSDWCVVDFGMPRRTNAVKLYLLDDETNIVPPVRIDLEMWNGKDWIAFPGQTRNLPKPTGKQANVIQFPEMEIQKLRAVFTHERKGRTGMTEFEAWGKSARPIVAAPPPQGNLAYNPGGKAFPKASASFTSRFDKVEWANDGKVSFTPTPHNRWTSYESPSTSDWLEIDFGAVKKFDHIELAIFDDRGGVQAPTSYDVESWDGMAWQSIKDQKKTPELPAGGQFNEVRFAPVETARLRVLFTHRGRARSGVSEIFVWGTEAVQPVEVPKPPVKEPKPPIEVPKPPVKKTSVDWPGYKGDVARSGVTAALVPIPLKTLWSHDSGQPPRPAWSEPGRALNMLDFDYCYQPVAADGLVFFGSSADDTVRALKAEAGDIVWSFTTGGPVRFAPQIVGDKCYFASDDGYAYCLETRTGKEVWRYRAALNDRQLLANGRMTSRWPCRSGVLVQDGVLYVTAGMWPSEGVFLHALDAVTGKPIWCNDTSCYDYVEYPHAPSVSFGGPAPQGYLLFGKQTLVVPTGRCAPAAFDAKTGKLLHFWANSPNRGGTWATLAGDHIFVSAVAWQPDQSVRLGESVPHRADSVAALALRSGKEEWPWDKAVMEFTDELKLPRWRSQVGHGIFSRQRVLFQGERFFTLGNGKADAFEITGDKSVKRLWSVPCPRVYSEALAGNALLVGSQDKLVALNPETGVTLAEIAVPGQIRGLAVADGRVIATTERGQILALGDGPELPLKQASPSKIADALDAQIQVHASALGGKGFAVVASATDAQLAQHLAESTQMHVLCLLPGKEKVEAERRRLLSDSTLYGSRVAVLPIDLKSLPMVSHFANLVIVSGKHDTIASPELYRVLRPCGGRMLFQDGADGAAIIREAGIPVEEVKKAEATVVLRGHLPGEFDWNSKAQADERVRWPLEFQWFGEPSGQLLVSRHAKPRTPIPAHGRLFIFGESHVTAIDAYNGSELWRRRLSVGVCTGQQPVSADDRHLYVQDGSVTWQFDAQNGKLLKAFGKEAGPAVHSLQKPLEITAHGKKGEAGTVAIVRNKDGLQITLTTESKAPTRDDRWELAFDFRSALERLNAPGKGTFELIVDPWKGILIPHQTHPRPEVTIKTLDSDKEGTKSIVLTFPREPLQRWLGRDLTDFALAADVKLWTEDFRQLLWGKPLTAGSGKRAWPNEAEAVVQLSNTAPKSSVPFGSLDELPEVALNPGRLPPMTRSRPDGDYSADFKEGLGKENTKGKLTMLQRVLGFEAEKRKHPLTGDDVSRDYSRSYGCSGTSCSAAMDFFRSGTIGMVDRLEDSGMRNISGIRSGCGQTLIPAFGLLLYSESTSDCLCSYSFATSLAMAPAASQRNEDWALFDDKQLAAGLVRKSALNLGAPGDRRDKNGTLWLGFPRPALGVAKKMAWQVPYSFETAPGFSPYRINTDRQPIQNSDRPWIYGSGIKGLTQLKLDLVYHQPSKVLLSLSPGQAPTLDGDVNDACWDGFGTLPLTDRNANVYFRHDRDNLYVAYEQKAHFDRLGKKLPWKASVKGKDDAFERDDHLRLSFFNPKGTRVVTLAVTAGGGTYDALLDLGKDGSLKEKRMPIPPEDSAWDGVWQAKTQRSAEAFRAEIAIPWKTLTDAGLMRETLSVECQRKTRWGGAKDASLLRLVENGVEIHSIEKPAPRRFTVRLHFAELDDIGPGERVFDVMLQGRTILKDFDVAKKAGGRFRAIVEETRDIEADRQLDIRFVPKKGTLTDRNAPILSGIEVLQQ